MEVNRTSSESVPYDARTAPEVEISIELLSHPLTLKVNLKNTIEELKEKMRAEMKASEDEKISLLYEGQTMEDDRTLASYKITKDSVIYQASNTKRVITNKSLGFGIEFNALTDTKKLEIIKVGPKYWTVAAGLNFRGTCSTQGCDAFNNVIWIQKGMGTFNVCEEVYMVVCPICKKTADKVDNLGFFNCIYSITGFQVKPDKKKVEKNDLVAEDKDFTTFEQTGILHHWATLTITTKSRKT
ncbi:MAG: hypothetical protein H0T62_08140 [Parachlamydiaceae bacterium]|nr:hypothetical protein [Parachlamydiaceae bacterium]